MKFFHQNQINNQKEKENNNNNNRHFFDDTQLIRNFNMTFSNGIWIDNSITFSANISAINYNSNTNSNNFLNNAEINNLNMNHNKEIIILIIMIIHL